MDITDKQIKQEWRKVLENTFLVNLNHFTDEDRAYNLEDFREKVLLPYLDVMLNSWEPCH